MRVRAEQPRTPSEAVERADRRKDTHGLRELYRRYKAREYGVEMQGAQSVKCVNGSA